MTDSKSTADRTSKWEDTVRAAVMTDVGMRRATNQDSMGAMVAETKSVWENYGHFFVVADGMGAHAAGELASQLAVELIPHHYRKQQGQPPAESLHKSIAEANAEIFRRGQANIEFRSMGTTCSVLLLLPEGAVAGHVGDSRVYQLRGEQLHQITFDHSLVWEMQAAGEVTDETARSGVIPKNVITRSLGPNANVQIDLEGPFPVRKGDRFLLCSDGLSGQVTDEEIGTLIRVLDPTNAAKILIDLSNLRGGPDNITAIVIEVASNEIATANQGAMNVRRNEKAKSFSPALGVVTAVCFSAALILLAISNWPLALVSSVLGIIALATGLAQVYMVGGSSVDESTTRYGRGPYRSYSASGTQGFFEHLVGTMKSLKEASEERGWVVNWDPINALLSKACDKADAKDFDSAIALQSKVVIELMHQIRKQRNGNASDSDVDL